MVFQAEGPNPGSIAMPLGAPTPLGNEAFFNTANGAWLGFLDSDERNPLSGQLESWRGPGNGAVQAGSISAAALSLTTLSFAALFCASAKS